MKTTTKSQAERERIYRSGYETAKVDIERGRKFGLDIVSAVLATRGDNSDWKRGYADGAAKR